MRVPLRGLAALAVAASSAGWPLQAADSDRRALEAIYDATGGPQWTESANWKSSAPLSEWQGVLTDPAGRVIELGLSAKNLTGVIPAALGQLTELRWLYLSLNSLSGPLPRELANLVNLSVLSASSNSLEGPIPAWLGSMASLRVLQLQENNFNGPVPEELGNLANLEHLELSYNNLSGHIPVSLERLNRLEFLDLQENNFVGPVPASLASLAHLQDLDLSFNWGLSGPLPYGLSELPRLQNLRWIVTGACAPTGWRDWLSTIGSSGRLCEPEASRVIDIAVFYTPAAREEAGGVEAIEAVIDLMLAETNDAYALSGVRHRLALVARAEVPYVEQDYDLQLLEDPADGVMDEVHAIRERTGADLVHLVAGGVHGLCGVATHTGAFGVTYQRCGGLVFAHEVGHNLALSHDRSVTQVSSSAYASPAYGYVNQHAFQAGSPRERFWHTIMAYNSQCHLEGYPCVMLPRFSNPRQSYGGDPLGVPYEAGGTGIAGPADAVAVINSMGAVVAAWRDRPADPSNAVNHPPIAVGTLPERSLASVGSDLVVDVSRAFVDPDSDALVYTVSSSAPYIVRAGISGARVMLTATGAGEASVRITATDTGGLSVSQLFSVSVEADEGATPGPGSPDRAVLTEFFKATGGANWNSALNWATSAPLHEWFGVETDHAGRVIALALMGNGLVGSLPPALGRLAQLRSMDLSSNALTGAIPGALGRLKNLETLHLMNNRLTGAVPPELGLLEKLVVLRLERNALGGRIPAALGPLTRLQILDLSQNALAGSIPGELGRLASLTALVLSRNDLRGTIPAALGNLRLREAELSHNWGLEGSLPDGWRQSDLEGLDIFLTRMCAPDAWRDWLAGIQFSGVRCGAAPMPVDVAVAYTPRAREEAGGTAAIEAEIDLMIATANEIFAMSGVRQRVELIGTAEVAYAETASGNDLERLAAPSDGYLDTAQDLRERVGADLLHLLVAGRYDVCGIANVPSPYKSPAPFGITNRSCGALTFVHEIGHNMGLRHDRFEVLQGERSRTFSHPAYGYVNQRATSSPVSRWRTIMSYGGHCRYLGIRCAELPRFSNPRQDFHGDPLGAAHGEAGTGLTGAADAAAVLDVTGPAVAAWRERKVHGGVR